jgi:hypothetical protein
MNQVKTPGEAISVLVQVAELAQAKGILSFDDAIVTKSAIDFLHSLSNGPVKNETIEEEIKEAEGPTL